MRAVFSVLIFAALLSGAFADPLPPALADAGIEERLGQQVDLSLAFRDETGKSVTLREYFAEGKPVLLNFAYFHCPMLCGLVQDGLVKGLKPMIWTPGQEFQVLTVSMDTREGPEQAKPVKEHLIAGLGKPEAASGWHALTGDKKSVESLAATVGFKFNYLPDRNEFAHGAGIIFLSGEGKVSRYLYGIEFPTRDLRLALLDASNGKELSVGDKLTMFCYRYDANSKSYVLFAQNFMKAGGVLVVCLLAFLLILMWRHESKRKRLSVAAEVNR